MKHAVLFVSVAISFALTVTAAAAANSAADITAVEKEFPLNEWPNSDAAACTDWAGDLYNLANTVQDECIDRFGGKIRDYTIISTHVLAAFVVPAAAPAVLAELQAEGKKDLTYCLFAGVIEWSGASASQKEQWKARLNSALEIDDSVGDFKGAGELKKFLTENKDKITFSDLKEFQEWAKSNPTEINNASLYSLWNIYGVKETAGTIEDISALESTKTRVRAAILESEKKTLECEFSQASADLKSAIQTGTQLLSETRASYLAAKKKIWCNNKELKRLAEINAPVPLSGQLVRSFESTNQSLAEKMKEIQATDQEQVQWIRQVMGLYVQAKEREAAAAAHSASLLDRLNEAEAALQKCEFDEASRIAKSIDATTAKYCEKAKPLPEAFRVMTFEKKIEATKEKTREDNGRIQQRLNDATSAKFCSEVENAVRSIEGIVSANPCVNDDWITRATPLRNMIQTSEKAAEELSASLVAANNNLQQCDTIGATTMIEATQLALSKLTCTPDSGSETLSDLKSLITQRDSIEQAKQKLLSRTAEILEHAEWAGKNCDTVRVQADAEQLANAVQEFAQLCKTPPQESVNAANRMQELLTRTKEKDEATAAMKEAKEALQACDPLEANLAADTLEFLGKVCDVDGPAEAQSIRVAAESIAKTRKTISGKISLAKNILDSGGNKQQIEQAQRYLQETDALLQKASPEACYEDLSAQLENLLLVNDLLTDEGAIADSDPGIEEDDDDFLGGSEGDDGVEDIPEDRGTDDDGVEDIPEDLGTEDAAAPAPTPAQPAPVPTPAQPAPVAAGPRWVLQNVTTAPERPDPGWSFGGPQASSAQLTVYNGDKAVVTWTPPPAEFGPKGFTISLTAQGIPVNPAGNIATLVGISASGLDANLPSDQWSAYARSNAGPSNASQSVIFTPQPTASEVEVKISLMWGGLSFTYKFRKVS